MHVVVYVVTREGRNIQGVHGPLFTLDSARMAAQEFARNDVDDYHTWDVRELTLVGLTDAVGSYRKWTPTEIGHDEVDAWDEYDDRHGPPTDEVLDVTSPEYRRRYA